SDNWPRCIQLAWQLHDGMGRLIENQSFLIRPEGFDIPYDAERIHGISTELAERDGIGLREALDLFSAALSKSTFIVGQNLGFDINIMGAEFHRCGLQTPLAEKRVLDTCTEITAELLQLPGGRGGRFKLPTLTELHQYLFNKPFAEAHNATADVEATTRCFFELIRKGVYSPNELGVDPNYITEFQRVNPNPLEPIVLKHTNLKEASEALRRILEKQGDSTVHAPISAQDRAALEQAVYVHLHNHTQFSVLRSTISIGDLVKATAAEGMPAVAMTDHANMMGAFHFVSSVLNHNQGVEARNK